MSFTAKIVTGLVLGVLVGLFFGEYASFLSILGEAFIGLLQMTVLPYILVSLIVNIGRLSPAKGWRLVRTGAMTLLGLLAIGVAVIVVTPLAFPQRAAGSFFRSSLVEISQPFDFIALYIPSNPFASLANNVVPAVVLFGILLGVAMIGLERKEVLLGPLDILGDGLNKLNKLVIRVTPAGVFAIAGGTAGTMTPEELVRLQAYLLAYSLVGVLLIFLVLPFVVTSLTPFRYRSLFSVFRDTLITIFATAKIIVVLPQLVENVKTLFKQAELQTEESDRAAETLLPLAYPFPNLGTFTIMIFVPFAAWYLGRTIETGDYLMFLSSLVPSSFVAPVTGIPFLLKQLQIPADMFELFVISTVYTDRIRVVIGAMHLIVLTVIVIAAAGGQFGLRRIAAIRSLVIVAVVSTLMLIGTYSYLRLSGEDPGKQYGALVGMTLQSQGADARFLGNELPDTLPASPSGSRIAAIKARGALRVGFQSDSLPFAYVNENGDAVGLDVELAHRLARDLGVNLELYRFNLGEERELLDRVDLLVGGFTITPQSAQSFIFSESYLEETLAFLVADYRLADFNRAANLRELSRPRIGYISASPHLSPWLESLLPGAELIRIESPRPFLRGEQPELDAVLFGALSGSAWTLIYPSYAVAIPMPYVIRFPLGLVIPDRDTDWQQFINRWVEVQRSNGVVDRLYAHWILGEGAEINQPRWSIMRDVLHWTGP